MSLETFKQSRTGARIAPILADPAGVAAMERKSREGRPAVEAVVACKKSRVAPGNLFSRGTVYQRPSPASANERSPSAAERIAAARAILAQSPFGIMSSDELIAERRREFERGE